MTQTEALKAIEDNWSVLLSGAPWMSDALKIAKEALKKPKPTTFIDSVKEQLKEYFPNSYVEVWEYTTPYKPYVNEIRARVDNNSAILVCLDKDVANELYKLIKREKEKENNG